MYKLIFESYSAATSDWFILTICACSKRDGAEENCDDYYIRLQKEKWKEMSDYGAGCSYWLGKGTYRSSVICFSDVQCINWNTAAKTSGVGVNCSGDSITVDSWSEVKISGRLRTVPSNNLQ